MKNRAVLVIGFCGIVLASPSRAVFERSGNLGAGARALGFGGAWVAMTENPESLYWNPAGLVRVHPGQMEAEAASLQNGRDHLLGFRTAGHLGLELRYGLGLELINRYTAGTMTEGQGWLGLALTHPGTGNAFGLSVKPLVVDGPTQGSSGAGFSTDFGATGELNFAGRKRLRWGMALYDVLHRFSWQNGGKEKLPRWLALGVAGQWRDRVSVAAGVEISDRVSSIIVSGKGALFRAGAEYWLKPQLFGLRAGITSLRTGAHQLSSGLSIGVRPFRLDYAYIHHFDLEASHRFTLLLDPFPNRGGPKAVLTEEPSAPTFQNLAATVYFDHDHSALIEKVIAALDDIRREAAGIENYKVYLHGYTSSPGSAKYNLWLSRRRALEVWQVLRNHLAPGTEAVIQGFGEAHLAVEPLLGREDEPRGRRVEIYVLPIGEDGILL